MRNARCYVCRVHLLLMAGLFSGCQESGDSSHAQRVTPPVTARAAKATGTANTTVALPWTPSVDTTWVVNLYEEADQFTLSSPFEQSEEYQQFDLFHSDVVKILAHLYGQDPTFKKRLGRLEHNRQQFYQATRREVVRDYRTYHVLEGMDFEYLCARQDSTIKKLILLMLADQQVEAQYKEYARKMLRQHYAVGS